MSADQAIRQQLARAVLSGLHPRCCGNFPAPLHERALRSKWGRRHLVRAALAQVPELFVPDQERWQVWLESEPWLLWSQTKLEQFTRELGALSLSPALRTVLERSRVLFLREVIGTENWRQLQAIDPWGGQASETLRLMGNVVLQRCGDNAQALRSAVFERGKIEFLGHAERVDASLASRLAAAYAVVPSEPCRYECWLPADAVAARLRQYMESAELSVDEAGAAA